MEIYASNEQQIAQLRSVIERAEGVRWYDDQVTMIIDEEAGSFFAGAKTAAEVADIIQSRVEIYVNENR
jgi:hypothetical protein